MTTRREFCAYSDETFLPRLVAMHESLERHCANFRLWLLCLDAATESAVERLALKNLVALRLGDVERADPEAAQARLGRTLIEYYLTLTPVLPLHVFKQAPGISSLTYLDSDLFFYADPRPLFDELGDGSVGILEHRFCRRQRHCEARHGRFNDGWVAFSGSAQARDCLLWWRQRCLEWCFNRVENGKFTEQKYLDEWPRLFPDVRVLGHPGANVGYWNMEELALACGADSITVDGAPLIFFHFSGFRRLLPKVYELSRRDQQFIPPRAAQRFIYRPYIEAMERALRRLRAAGWRGDVGRAGRDQEPIRGILTRVVSGLLSGRCAVSLR